MTPDHDSNSNPPSTGKKDLRLILLGVLGGVVCVVLVCTFICAGMVRSFLTESGFFGHPERSLQENMEIVKANPSAEKRGEAIQQIGKMGPKAEAAIPVLLEALRDDRKYVYRVMHQFTIHQKAADALVAIGGPKVVNGMLPLLADKDTKMVTRASNILLRLGPVAEGAVPALLLAWKENTDAKVQSELVVLLQKISEPKLVKGLSEFLSDKDDQVVIRAANTLSLLGPPAREAVPVLLTTLKKRTDEPVHGTILAALKGIGGSEVSEVFSKKPGPSPKPDAIKILQDALADAKAEVRADAAKRLGEMGPAAKSAAPALNKLLTDKDSRVRLEAAWALWVIVPQAKDTFAVMVSSLKNSDSELQKTAQQRLEQIGSNDLWALEELLKNFESKDKQLRLESVRAIGRMGPAVGKAKEFDRLVNALLHPDPEMQSEVARVLKNIPE